MNFGPTSTEIRRNTLLFVDVIRTRVVLYASELQKGDHVSRPTETARGRFDHHAIIVEHVHGSSFRIIHVTEGRSGSGSAKNVSAIASSRTVSAVVREETKDFGQHINTGRLVLYRYRDGECYDADTVISRARSCRGSFDYSLFKNNCEHFARWCKTGKSESYQVK